MRYEDLQEIGKNHYSVVFAAHDFNTHRDVVIMELLPQFQSNAARWEQIWQQVLTLSDAKLENTVPIYDLDRDRRWIIMEKMNTALQTELVKGPLDPKIVRGVLRQILVALDSLHKHDICHGDIKPANLLVNNEGWVRLSFSPGLKMGGQIPQRQKDFKYLCPEMLNPAAFGDIGPQSDLYCLGFTALELLIGPQFDSRFKGVTAGVLNPDRAWMGWHSSNQPSERLPSVAKLLPGMPQDLVTVIDRLLQKEVKNRYQSAAEALADLERTGQDPVIIPSGSGASTSPEPARKSATPPPSKSKQPGFLDKLKAMFASKPKVKSSAPVGNLTFSQKINRYLEERPALKYTVIGLVCLVFLFILFGVPTGKGGKTYAVEIVSVPAEANLTYELLSSPTPPAKDDKAAAKEKDAAKKAEKNVKPDPKTSAGDQPVKTPAKLKLAPGEYALHFELAGYEKLDEKITVKSKQSFSFDLKKLPPQPTSILPDGLVAVPGSERVTWEGKELPKRATSIKLTDLKAPLEFVLIMPKTFQYGVSDKDEPEAGELAAASETMKYPYYISVTEVTNDQLQHYGTAAKVELTAKWKENSEKLGAEGKTHPAVHVPFATAKSFCEWLSKRGKLPNEKEWEFAARGDTGHLLPWEDQAAPSKELANLMFNEDELHTVPVTDLEKGRSPLGLAHLVGNVAEWCTNEYRAGTGEEEDAPGAANSNEPFHTTRGGSFLSRTARLTTRANSDSDGAGHVGFRVVVAVQPAKPAASSATTKAKAKSKAGS